MTNKGCDGCKYIIDDYMEKCVDCARYFRHDLYQLPNPSQPLEERTRPELPSKLNYEDWGSFTINDLRNPEVCAVTNKIIDFLAYREQHGYPTKEDKK